MKVNIQPYISSCLHAVGDKYSNLTMSAVNSASQVIDNWWSNFDDSVVMAPRRSAWEEGDRAAAATSIIHHIRSGYSAVSVPLTSDLTGARPTVYNIRMVHLLSHHCRIVGGLATLWTLFRRQDRSGTGWNKLPCVRASPQNTTPTYLN